MNETPTRVAANEQRARFIKSSRIRTNKSAAEYTLQLPVPILRLRRHRPEDFHVPFAAAPRLDDLRRDDVDQDFREQAPIGIALEMIRRLVPAELGIEHQREE